MKTLLASSLIACFVLLFSSQLIAHGMPQTSFTISEQEGILMLKIEIEEDHLLEAMEGNHPNDDEMNKAIENYLKTHLQIRINEEEIDLRFTKHNFVDDHFVVSCELLKVEGPIRSIELETDCLVDEVDEQVNNVFVDLYGRFRGFKLDKDRKVALIEYFQ